MSTKKEQMQEAILTDPGFSRFSLFPIQHQDLWKDFYKKHKDAFWTAEEVDLSNDLEDWKNLSENEQYFIKNILGFFSQSDSFVEFTIFKSRNIVNEKKIAQSKIFRN